MPTRSGLLLDASVLIDYALADISVLEMVARHVSAVHIPLPLLDEVDQVSRTDCERLGIIVAEPDLGQLLGAGSQRGGPLSFQDRLCVVIAQVNGWTAVSNDKALRQTCERQRVKVMWGLELMGLLVDAGQMTARQAIRTAQAISKSNPRFITNAVLARFEVRVKRRR